MLHAACDVEFFLPDRRDIVKRVLRCLETFKTGNNPSSEIVRSLHPPAVAMLPLAQNGFSWTPIPASPTQGLVVRSMQAGMLSSQTTLCQD
ncbi:hypothetical protein EMQ_1733 [Acetobacter aceti NBRC 14818]|uniref:Uncharacterized protein n=1 Tax=Acetobacter aceti NBRC 14818 TaxID=887700 RepID=A0AB33IG33_ACEAC|nr:hypothetical protein EMQ_1733 [Acetobacter aceti NBRC 14818]GAN57690.1 hypothetical protein Abac_018_103 [Acetobacter aceti NBRC 14818]